MTVTFISAFFPPEGGSYRAMEKYRECFAMMASSGIPIVLYLDPTLKDYGAALEEYFPNIRVADYLEVDRSFLTRPLYLPRNRNAQKAQLSCFVKNAFHQPFFLMVDGVEMRYDFAVDEVNARLLHHELFFSEFFGDEHLTAVGVFDEELTAGEGLICN
jgi:hypothetical protein